MTDEQTADEILSDARWERELSMERDPTTLRAAIVRALQAARKAPPGHIIDDAGVVRKVLRPLMHTLDGAIVQEGDWVFHGGSKWLVSNGKIPVAQALQSCGAFCGYRDIGADECWSTKEAAEAAKEAQ